MERRWPSVAAWVMVPLVMLTLDAGEHLLGFVSGRCHQYSRLKGPRRRPLTPPRPARRGSPLQGLLRAVGAAERGNGHLSGISGKCDHISGGRACR
jgi:hypothetical protein